MVEASNINVINFTFGDGNECAYNVISHCLNVSTKNLIFDTVKFHSNLGKILPILGNIINNNIEDIIIKEYISTKFSKVIK